MDVVYALKRQGRTLYGFGEQNIDLYDEFNKKFYSQKCLYFEKSNNIKIWKRLFYIYKNSLTVMNRLLLNCRIYNK
ncbi:hypothetical protein Anas_06152 [Armadillidium nasatum]|uniref:Histone H4 n=1 Tax=Armadillidium nasatum TaxID=96803 RepID=A0A5N5SS42_9CRUS|nr:hypothetical protein Anas_06152 [Armadillidium nasatum]